MYMYYQKYYMNLVRGAWLRQIALSSLCSVCFLMEQQGCLGISNATLRSEKTLYSFHRQRRSATAEQCKPLNKLPIAGA